MANKKRELIGRFCDVSNTRLEETEKDILCEVISNPDRYNGAKSKVFTRESSGKDYKGRWSTTETAQYTINIDENELSLDEEYHLSCDDGYSRDQDFHITNARGIVDLLKRFLSDL